MMDHALTCHQPDDWATLPPDLLLLAMCQAPAASHKAVRATCTSWCAAINCSLWRSVRGDLRNPDLGALPAACRTSSHLRRLELTFNAGSNTVSELGSPSDWTAFTGALARLRLHEYGEQQEGPELELELAGPGPRPGGGRACRTVLALHFGNYRVYASTVEALLSTAPGLLDAWPFIEVYAHALPSTWPGQSPRAGLVLDGGLSMQLTATGKVLGMDLRGRRGGVEAGWKLAGGAYRRLATCCLPVRGTALALESLAAGPATAAAAALSSPPAAAPARGGGSWGTYVWAATEGHEAAAALAAAAPGVRLLRLAGPEASEGLGACAGALLRPEHVAFCCMPPSIEEVEFVGAEMPRVHYSSSHLKPWEAVLLVDTVDYLVQHFVKPLAAALPRLLRVKCLATRVPRGTVLSPGNRRLTSEAWPMAPAAPVAGSAGAAGAEDAWPAALWRQGEGSNALWTFTWAGAEMRRAAGSSMRQQVWRVSSSFRDCGDIHEARDGLYVEQCDIAFEREE